MKDCLFCQIINKDIPAWIIYEDELTLAFLDITPDDDGHSLIIPKKHVSSFMNADWETIAAVTRTKKKVAELIQEKLHPKGFNFTTNNGEEAFQAIFHYHEHVIPKYVKTEGYAPHKQNKKLKTVETIYTEIKNN